MPLVLAPMQILAADALRLVPAHPTKSSTAPRLTHATYLKNSALAMLGTNQTPLLEPHEERLLTFPMLAKRRSCNSLTAAQPAKDIRLPLIHWNLGTICVRHSDVLRAELEATRVGAT